MIKWVALVMAWFALVLGASSRDLDALSARLASIENQKCTLMSVTTPAGSAIVCVELLRSYVNEEKQHDQ